MSIKTITCLLLLLVTPILSNTSLKFSTVQNSDIAHMTQEILKIAYLKLGIEISVDEYPAKRSLHLSNEGKKYDGELHRIMGIEKQYTNLIPIPIPIHFLEGVVLSKSVKFAVKGWKSLEPYTIGVRRGIVFTVNGTRGMKRVLFNSHDKLFQMLDNKRLDIIILPRMSALKYLQGSRVENVTFFEPPVQVYKMYHYLHKKNSHLIVKITSILKKMEEDGIIEKVRQKYIQKLQ